MTDTTDITPRNQYFAIVSMTGPIKTTITVASHNLEDAKKVVADFFKDSSDLEIVDIYDVREAPNHFEFPASDTPTVLN